MASLINDTLGNQSSCTYLEDNFLFNILYNLPMQVFITTKSVPMFIK